MGMDMKWFRFDSNIFESYNASDTALLQLMPPSLHRQQKIYGQLRSGFSSLSWNPKPAIEVEGGLRWSRSSLNQEDLWQPRLLTRFIIHTNMQLWLSAGQYAQPPLSREFLYHSATGKPLRAQKLTLYACTLALQRPRHDLRLTLYHNQWRDLIRYDLQDVRLVFSGENDARGYAYGADAQLRAELLPGIMHWISYSYMVAREDLLHDAQGHMPRPTDVRHTLAIYSEDQMEKWQHSRFHLRVVFSSGYPVTLFYWRNINGIPTTIVSQNRLAGRLPHYMRLDVGLTQNFKIKNATIQLKEEILNLFDKVNIIGYDYVYGDRVLDTLASRTFNLSMRVEL